MKKLWLLLLGILLGVLFASNVFAVNAKVKSITRDEPRNIFWVVIEYTMEDGEVIENAYPVTTFNLMDKTQSQIQEFLVANVKSQCRSYIAHEFFERNDILENKLSQLIGAELTVTETDVEYDYDNDGTVDKAYTVKEDGTYVEKVL
jgi:hypothetical protein